jgi:hypothetical protein
MASISAAPGLNAGALAVLQAPNAPLSGVSSIIPQSVLDGASPTDLADISSEASSLSEVEGLYGLTPAPTVPPMLQAMYGEYGLSSNGSPPPAPSVSTVG